jgi:hypothetical protein
VNETRQGRVVIAWILCGLSVGLVVASLVLQILTADVVVGGLFGFRGATVVPTLVFALLGLLLALRLPDNPIGWLFLGASLTSALQRGGFEYGAFELIAGRADLPGAEVAAWLGGWLWVPLVGIVAVFVIMLFPDGRFLSSRWRDAGWLGGVAIVLTSLGFATLPGPMESAADLPNPFAIRAPWLEPVTLLSVFGLYVTSCAAAAASLVLRFKRARTTERAQIKWVAYAAGLLALVFIAGAPVFAADQRGSIAFRVLSNLLLLALSGVPVGVAIGVLRYRLYEIDRVINRTLVYAALTAVLATAYFGLVVVMQSLFATFTADSDVAVAASTLAVAALFRPAKSRVQGFIDRRFYRRKYDAEQTLRGFSERLRNEVELDALEADVLGVVADTVRPAHVSLWLRELHPPLEPEPEPATQSRRRR